jgi:hypothetical protein
VPFDGLPEGLISDLVKLRIALDGIKTDWMKYGFGTASDAAPHCAIGWLLVATDWDTGETTRLALKYLYPALPEKAKKRERLESIWNYNDGGGRERIVRLFGDAVKLAEQAVD